MWWNSVLGALFVWFSDGTSSQWVPANPVPMLGGGTGDFSAAYSGADYALTGTSQVINPPVIAGNASGAYNVSNGRWTPPAGRYVISAACSFLYTGGNTGAALQIRKNGTGLASSFQSTQIGFTVAPALSIEVDANGSDFFDLFLTGYTAGSLGRQNSFTATPLTGMQGPMGPAGSGGGSGGGTTLQTVFFETGALATGTTTIPFDDTIPQQTEGDQYMSLAITPKSATSKLLIDVVFMCATSTGSASAIAVVIFQDATANALAVGWVGSPTPGTALSLSFRHTMTSGTTSSTTFKVRAGGAAAGTTTFNGANSGRFFGGTMASSIVIREVLP
jgi:hypothetical protein